MKAKIFFNVYILLLRNEKMEVHDQCQWPRCYYGAGRPNPRRSFAAPNCPRRRSRAIDQIEDWREGDTIGRGSSDGVIDVAAPPIDGIKLYWLRMKQFKRAHIDPDEINMTSLKLLKVADSLSKLTELEFFNRNYLKIWFFGKTSYKSEIIKL